MPIYEIFQRAREHAQVDEAAVSRSPDFDDFDSQEGRCILAAIREYSIDIPYKTSTTLTTVNNVALLPTDWKEDWKALKVVTDYSDKQTFELDANYWVVRYDTTLATPGWVIIFLKNPPDTCVLESHRPHNEDPFGTNTIPLRDEEAVAMLAASKILSAAQSWYSKKSDMQGLGADTIDYRGLAAKSRQAASDCISKYKKHVDKVNGAGLGSSHIFSWEGTSGIDGRSWVIHKTSIDLKRRPFGGWF